MLALIWEREGMDEEDKAFPTTTFPGLCTALLATCQEQSNRARHYFDANDYERARDLTLRTSVMSGMFAKLTDVIAALLERKELSVHFDTRT